MGDNKEASVNAQLGKEKLGLEGLTIQFSLPPNTKVISGPPSTRLVLSQQESGLLQSFAPKPIAKFVKAMDDNSPELFEMRTQKYNEPMHGEGPLPNFVYRAFYPPPGKVDSTWVTLRLTQTELTISISPALIIDPFMAAEYGLSKIVYSFKAHDVTPPPPLTEEQRIQLLKPVKAVSTIQCHQPARDDTFKFDRPSLTQSFKGAGKAGDDTLAKFLLERKPPKPQPAVVTLPSQYTGGITDIQLEATGWLNRIRPTETIKNHIRDAFLQMLKNTRFSKVNYNPLEDPDPMGGLNEIRNNMKSAPNTATVNIGLTHIEGIRGSVQVITKADINRKAGSGGIEIPSGTKISIEISLLGNGQQITNQLVGMSYAGLESDGIYLVKGSERAAKLKRVYLDRGGAVTVGNYEGMGALNTVQGLEGLVRLFAAATGQGFQQDVGRTVIADSLLQSELTKAVKDIYIQNFDALQNAVRPCDLSLFFGMDRTGKPTEFPK